MKVMSETLTDKFNASLGGYVPASPGWYLREQNSAGENVYHPVMAWRECAGTGLLSDGWRWFLCFLRNDGEGINRDWRGCDVCISRVVKPEWRWHFS
jgi:hypothetical protein